MNLEDNRRPYMVLEKVIKKINIQSEYKPFVEEYTAGLLSEFKWEDTQYLYVWLHS